MSLRATIHLGLHLAVPGLVAWLWCSSSSRAGSPGTGGPSGGGRAGMETGFDAGLFRRAWLLLLLGWLIDLDHLLADPIYAPDRCSIGFHPLHTAPAIAAYAVLAIPRPTRLFGIGLLIHVGLDLIDCLWMRHAGG